MLVHKLQGIASLVAAHANRLALGHTKWGATSALRKKENKK